MFSILVTASPVLVCTAVLLGLLLSFGSPNIPEFEKKGEEERVSHAVSSLKTRATVDDSLVKRGAGRDGFVVERRVGKMRGIGENDFEKVSLVDNEDSEVEEDGSISYKRLVDERLDSMGIHSENGVIDRVQGMPNDLLLEKKREFDGAFRNWELAKERSNPAVVVHERNLDVHHNKFAADFRDVPKDKDEYLDSGSDGTESSSPDASMADIMPVVDELHPLLGSEEPQPALLSVGGSYAVSERSHGSINDDSVDSDEFENPREEDNDDNEGKGAKTDTEDESKSAIKWTEDDQKNLIELGTSELERNQRLEILIARRRAHKNMNSMTVKNVVNLDGADIPSHISPISTRQNPFELPDYSCDDLGLPPIPGSAPSIFLPRNPFDLPCGSSEEIPVPKGDSFPVDFSGFNQREKVPPGESIFRRHESFNVGPSSFGFPRQELNWKPFFVPDRVVTEGAPFLRQSSEASESKMSSVPDTESVSSVLDEEDNKPNEHGVSREIEPILNEGHASVHDEQESQSSGNVKSINAVLAKNRDAHLDVVEIVLGDGQNQLEMESDLYEAAAAHMEFNASEIHSEREPVMDDSSSSSSTSSSSSSSSSSETDEEMSDAQGEDFACFEPEDHETKESGFSTQPSFEESEFHCTSSVADDNQHREPVYDSSPPPLEKFFSFSSVSANTLAEISEMGLPLTLVRSTDEKPKAHGKTTEQSASSSEEMHVASSDLLNEKKPRARDMAENSMLDVKHVGPPGVSSSSDHNVVEYFSPDAGSSSSDEGLENVASETTLAVDRRMGEVLDSSPKEDMKTRTNAVLPVLEARSAEDIDLAFKQLHEGVGVEEIIVPSMIEKLQDHADNKAKLPVVEARSLEDINKVFQQATESNPAELPYSSGLKNESSKDTKTQTNVVLPVLEAKSAEDIDLAFKQLHEGVNVEEVIVPSMIEKQQDHGDIKSKLPVVEARSLEDIHKAFQQDSKSSLAELPTSSGYKKTENNVVLPVLEARSAEDIDLAFKQLHEGVDVEEVIVPSMIEKLQDYADNKTKLPVVEARSLEDIHKVFHQAPESSPAELLHPTKTKTNIVLPVLEAKSAEDIDLAFKQLHEGVDVEEVIVPSMIEKLPDHGDIKSKLPVVEARSLDDIQKAFQQDSESSPAELPTSSGYTKAENNVVLPVLEAKSAEDIDLAFKQLHEGVDVEEIIVPSMIEKLQDHADNKAKLPVVEARSLDDIDKVFQQAPESSPAELPHSSGLKNKSSKDTKTQTNVVLPVLEAKSAEDIDLAFKQLREGVDVEEVIVPSMIEKQQDYGDTKSKLPVVEARSLEDIHKVFHQAPESIMVELPQSSDFMKESLQDTKTDTNVVLPVLEARSAEDIDLAFKQLNEGVNVEDVIVPSMIEKAQDHGDIKSNLPVVEASSLEDLHNSFQQGLELNPA
ncbi:hypothetical protein GQ457_02G029770 [Hibiscus cannabinus]